MGAVVGAAALRPRRGVLAVAGGAVACAPVLVMAVVVVALGGVASPAEVASVLDIPPVAMDAYARATASPAAVECGLRWQVLAGVGRVESNHATGRSIGADGSVAPPILGPVLDGTGATAPVADTDAGRLDGDAAWDRAVGPMQFLPGTWRAYGADANHDGVADPHNLYDAAVAAAAYLCAGRGAPLTDAQALDAALRRYNRSDAYVAEVGRWIAHYDDAAASEAAGPGAASGTIVDVGGIRVDEAIAAQLGALLAAAQADGVVLGGSGHRTHDDQVALRRAHCGTSTYAVYEMPAAACRPPTARPGESLHQSGLAVDFTCGAALVARHDRCFSWLATHAGAFGLRNLESEPWHWSTTGQ